MTEHAYSRWTRIASKMTDAAPWLRHMRGCRPLLPLEACRMRYVIALEENDLSMAERCKEDLQDIDRHLSLAGNGV